MNPTSRCIGYLLGDPGIDLSRHEGGRFHVEHIVGGLRAAGHECRLVAVQPGEVVRLDLGEGLRDARPETRPDGSLSSGLQEIATKQAFSAATLARSDLAYRAGRRAFAGCELVHTRLSPFDLGAQACAADLAVPLVVEVNAPPVEEALQYYPFLFDEIPERLARFAARTTLTSATRVVAVSSALRDLLVSDWGADPARIEVLPNAADPAPPSPSAEREAALRTRFDLGAGPLLVFVGALQPWHGLDGFFRAFAGIRERHPEARTLIVGDGVMRRELEQQVETLGLGGTVHFAGAMEQTEVLELLGCADIAVAPYPRLPIEFYFSPLKLFEYMAAGRAIVASRIGQVAEVLGDGETALLVEPGAEDELAAALDKLLGDPELGNALGAAARAQARREHTWDRYVERLTGIYADAIAGYRSAGS